MNQERTSLFLMANLGSEVSRIIAFQKTSDADRVKESLTRALVILQKLIQLPDMERRRREMDLLGQVITDVARENPRMKIPARHITSYFRPFALRLLWT